MDVPEGAGILSVERFGPAWRPGPFELGTDGPGIIVVGVDGSRTAMRAAFYAAGLARRQGSRLVVVYVTSTPAWVSMVTVGAGAGVAEEARADLLEEIRSAAAARAEEMGLSVTLIVRYGDPLIGLRRTADEMKADLLVVGASEGAGHRVIGSLAGRLVRTGRWPVTVVP